MLEESWPTQQNAMTLRIAATLLSPSGVIITWIKGSLGRGSGSAILLMASWPVIDVKCLLVKHLCRYLITISPQISSNTWSRCLSDIYRISNLELQGICVDVLSRGKELLQPGLWWDRPGQGRDRWSPVASMIETCCKKKHDITRHYPLGN